MAAVVEVITGSYSDDATISRFYALQAGRMSLRDRLEHS
jgi:hypothetical protein